MMLSTTRAPRWRAGFTLIEILVVVAVISILAAIAVPNFLNAQTRAKVARMKNDLRVLSEAAEAYHVDHETYPDRKKYPRGAHSGLGDVATRLNDMAAFTTPIAYISQLPEDVFEQNVPAPNNVIDYYSPEVVREIIESLDGQTNNVPDYLPQPNDPSDSSFGYMFLSVGPDGELGVTGNQGNYPVHSEIEDHYREEYDPTNGTTSRGNISRFHKNGATSTDAFQDL